MKIINNYSKVVPLIIFVCVAFFIAQTSVAMQEQTLITIADFKPKNVQLTLDTAQVTMLSDMTSSQTPVMQSQLVITGLDASFIKVYFDNFNLPAGSYVRVSNTEGSEVYTYGAIDKDDRTYDSIEGEDGISRFASMSISGDTAVVSLIITDVNAWDSTQHGVSINRYSEGYPEARIKALLAGENSQGVGDNAMSLFSTCGANQRRDAVCYQRSHPTEYARSRPVARLLYSGRAWCTAWRVGNENRMMTNNHCMRSASQLTSIETWFNYQRSTCGGSSNGRVIKVSGNQFLSTDRGLDYSLYTVNNFNSIASFGNLGLDVRAPRLGEEIYIPQHGAGNPKELAIESDQNQGNVCRVDNPLAIGTGNGRTDIGYYCDTIGGSSGSPVLARSSHKVVALHHLGGCHNKGARINEIWPKISRFFPNGIPNGSR